MDYIEDETDFFEVPDLLITLDWLKKAYPEKKQDFLILDYFYIHGYKQSEICELTGLAEWQIRESIKNTLELIKSQMTK